MSYLLMLGITLGLTALLAVSWLGWQLLRQNGRMLLRLEGLEKRLDELEFGVEGEPAGLPLDSLAPDFALPDLEGEHHSLAEYRGQPSLLVFFNPACGFCRDLLPRLADKMRTSNTQLPASNLEPGSRKQGEPQVVIVSTGDPQANRQLFNEHQVTCPVLHQKGMEVATMYKANGTPSGYLVDSDGRIASELAMGGEALLKLLEGESRKKKEEMDDGLLSPALSSNPDGVGTGIGEGEEARTNRFKNHSLARSKLKRDGLKAGTPAPDFRLPRVDGRGELTLSEFGGRRVLLVFSSPHCGPCNTLAPELEKFHRAHPELQVLMISRGEPKENRAKIKEHVLTFPVVLQQQWEISRLYSMFATPVAYLINEDGIIGLDVAVGIEPILALFSKATSPKQLEARFVASVVY